MPLPFGDIEHKYQLLHKLAEGGMGAVYKVRHRLLDEIRVIKVVNPVHASSERARRRFEQEARAATQLRHPNIAQIFDYVTGDQGAYLVMEFIDGATFKQILKSAGPQPLGLTVEMARQALEALGYLHDRGYLHRDVAPDNLMLTLGRDGQPVVKLIDLGLAKKPAERLDLTGTNMFIGKVRYSSPEIFRHAAEAASPRSDIYSFGVVLYELLTGQCPMQGSSFEELATAHLLEAPLSFEHTDAAGRVPEELRSIVLKTLEKRPQARPSSAAELAEMLRPFADSGPWPLPALASQPPPSDSSDAPTLDASGVSVAAAMLQGAEAIGETVPDTPRHLSRTEGSRRALKLLRWLGLGLAAGLLTLAGWWLVERRSSREPELVVTAPALGRLEIDAVPWARITSVIDAEGRRVPIGRGRDTPAVLHLPVGDYEVQLEHPDFPPSGVLRVTVPVAGAARLAPRLGTLPVDAYFESIGLAEQLIKAGEGGKQ